MTRHRLKGPISAALQQEDRSAAGVDKNADFLFHGDGESYSIIAAGVIGCGGSEGNEQRSCTPCRKLAPPHPLNWLSAQRRSSKSCSKKASCSPVRSTKSSTFSNTSLDLR